MDIPDLKNLFLNAIKIRGSKNLPAADDLWRKVEDAHEKNSVVTLPLVSRSLTYVPRYLTEHGETFDLVVVAQLMQRLSRISGIKHVETVLQSGFGLPPSEAKLAQELSEVKNSLMIREEPPFNLMHDINLVRLAFPFNDFLTNQLGRVKSHVNFRNSEDFLLAQMRLCRFWLGRGRIFAQRYFINKYENDALENIKRYVDLEDQILDLLSNIPLSEGLEGKELLDFNGSDAALAARALN